MQQFPKGKYYATIGGAQKLHEEMEALETKRAEVSKNIKTAKGFGDLSENFEYHEAKREQGFVEGRIQQLKIIIPSLEVVPPNPDTNSVSFGSIVQVREDDMDEWEVMIVGPLEANPMEDKISYESPLGAALIGRKVGEVFTATVPAGEVQFEVLSIRSYEP